MNLSSLAVLTLLPVWLVLLIFNAGWIASLLIWIFVIEGYANTVTDAAG